MPDIISAIQKAAGKDGGVSVKPASTIGVLGWLHSGNYALNWAVSGRLHRGYPLGHTMEIFGDPSTGKSLLIFRALAEAQAVGGTAALDDPERAFHLSWAEGHLGVESERLAYRDPPSRTVEDHIHFCRTWLSAVAALHPDKPAVLALDSLGMLSTEHELDPNKTARDLTKARLVHELFRVLTNKLGDFPGLHIMANHKYSSFDAWTPDESSGGKGGKYASTVRLDLRQPTRIKAQEGSVDKYAGVIIRVVVAKNRIVQPWREVRMAIPFQRVINPYSGLIPILLDIGFLEVSGNNLVYQEEDTGIKAHRTKTSFLKQDASAADLVLKYPHILEDADAFLDETEPGSFAEVEDG